MQLNRKTLLKKNLEIIETTRPIKKNVNMSCAETENQATKYLRDLTKHLEHTLDAHIFDGPPSDLS